MLEHNQLENQMIDTGVSEGTRMLRILDTTYAAKCPCMTRDGPTRDTNQTKHRKQAINDNEGICARNAESETVADLELI